MFSVCFGQVTESRARLNMPLHICISGCSKNEFINNIKQDAVVVHIWHSCLCSRKIKRKKKEEKIKKWNNNNKTAVSSTKTDGMIYPVRRASPNYGSPKLLFLCFSAGAPFPEPEHTPSVASPLNRSLTVHGSPNYSFGSSLPPEVCEKMLIKNVTAWPNELT